MSQISSLTRPEDLVLRARQVRGARCKGGGESRSARGARDSDSDSDEDEEEDDDDDEQGATRGKVLEMRRVGDKTWRKFRSQPDAEKAFGIGSGSVSKLVNKTRKLEGFEARYVDGDLADAETHYDLAVGDRVTVDGAPGVVEALPEGYKGRWKVRLDGEGQRSGK